jgi:hypothetical protein
VLRRLLTDAQQPNASAAAGGAGPQGAAHSEFSRKTDEASAEVYFRYYGMLQHQQVRVHATPLSIIVAQVWKALSTCHLKQILTSRLPVCCRTCFRTT